MVNDDYTSRLVPTRGGRDPARAEKQSLEQRDEPTYLGPEADSEAVQNGADQQAELIAAEPRARLDLYRTLRTDQAPGFGRSTRSKRKQCVLGQIRRRRGCAGAILRVDNGVHCAD